MTRHFDAQIHRLKRMILELGSLVENAVERALVAVEDRDAEIARLVIDGDRGIDVLEIDIGEECLHTLALYQPVASDLRYVGSILTINKDLERIADLAVNMAEEALRLVDEPPVGHAPIRLHDEGKRVREMLTESLDALVHMDAERAERVIASDDEVDAIHEAICRKVEQSIIDDPSDARRMLEVLSVSRNLERIADHAVNIAEDVVYVVRGEIVRHSHSRGAL